MRKLLLGLSLVFAACGSADDSVADRDDALTAHAPGELDLTFGGAGTGQARVRFGADDDGLFRAMDVVDGKIVATGFGTGGLGQVRIATIRLAADGTIDPTWNAGQVVRTSANHGNTHDDTEAFAVGHQADGRSVVIGFNFNAGSTPPCPCTEDIAAARFSATGGDGGPGFGTAGFATVDLGGTEDVRAGVVLASDAIIAVGSQDGQFMVAQLAPDGTLDPAFAANGFDRVVHGDASEADAAVVDRRGRLVVAGTFTTGTRTALNLIRYRANGTHDPKFGAAGEVRVAHAGGEQAVALRTFHHKLVLASSTASGLRVRRFLADGQHDTRFGTAGIAEVAGAGALDMVVLADGRIVVLTADSQLVRLTRQGALDPTFGTAGKQPVSFGESGVPGGLQVYSDDQILVSGGDDGGSPGPGTFGVVERFWM